MIESEYHRRVYLCDLTGRYPNHVDYHEQKNAQHQFAGSRVRHDVAEPNGGDSGGGLAIMLSFCIDAINWQDCLCGRLLSDSNTVRTLL